MPHLEVALLLLQPHRHGMAYHTTPFVIITHHLQITPEDWAVHVYRSQPLWQFSALHHDLEVLVCLRNVNDHSCYCCHYHYTHHMAHTYYAAVKISSMVRAQREPENKVKKVYSTKKPNVTRHVFAQTTHLVTAPHGFAHVVVPTT